MADQIPSLKDLAKIISGDIAEKLGLSSDSSISKMLLKELQALSSSNKILAKVVEVSDKSTTPTDQLVKPPEEKPQSKLPNVFAASLKSVLDSFLKEKASADEPKSELEKIEKPKDVRIIGFDEAAVKGFKLSEILGKPLDLLTKTLGGFKKGFEGIAAGLGDLKDNKGIFGDMFSKLVPAGTLTALAGAAGIIGGIGALVAAWNTQGPEKGTLELIGKVGLLGGLKAFAKTIFKGASKQMLKRIPIIGTLISYGFAWQAFKNKDIPKGILELTSGTLQLLDLVAPGLGTILSSGVDVLNAVLDAKAGGSSEEAGAKKVEILKGWVDTLKDKVMSNIEKVPILGDFVKIGKSLSEGKNEKALEQLAEILPALHWVKTVLRSKTALTVATGALNTAGNILTAMGDWISGKISKLFSPILTFFTKNQKTVLAEAEKLGEEIVPKAKGILNPIKDAIIKFGKDIIKHLKDIFSPLTSAFKEIGEDLLKKGTGILNKAKGLLTPVGEGIEKLTKKLTGHLGGLFNPVKTFFTEIGENILKKGSGLLSKVKVLLEPITGRVEKLGNTMIDHLGDIFKPVKNFLGNLTESLSKKASNLVAPITNLVKTIGNKLFSIGDGVFKVFKSIFSGMFSSTAGATVEGVAKSSLLGKFAGFLPKFLGGVTGFLKKVPFIGSILSIASLYGRLTKSGGADFVGAGIEALSIISGIFLPGTGLSLGLDVLNGILDSKTEGKKGKEGNSAKLDILGKWITDAGDWLYKKLKNVPYIGSMIEVGHLIATNPIGALKALGRAVPVLGSVVEMFGKTFPKLVTGDTSKVGFTDIFNEIGKWAYNKIKEWPVVGPLVKAWGTFASDPVGVLQTLGTSFPVLNNILSFFGVKSKRTTAGMEFAQAASTAFFDFDKIIDWIHEKILDFPIIGNLLKAMKTFVGDPIGVLRGLAESIPTIKNILSFFDSKLELNLPELSFQFKNPFEGLNQMVSDKAKQWWDKTTSWISDLNPFKDEEKDPIAPQPNAAPKQETNQTAPSVTPKPKSNRTQTVTSGVLGDAAIDPNGGLLISSPKVGSLYQLNKQDGVVAAPVVENKVKNSTPAVSFGKAEAILEKIAANTGTSSQNISNLITGFNNLAKALEKTLGESAKIPVVINNSTTNQSSNSPTSSQYANAGNNTISSFRTATVEASRFRPA